MCVCMSTCIYHPSEIIMSVSYNELQRRLQCLRNSAQILKALQLMYWYIL